MSLETAKRLIGYIKDDSTIAAYLGGEAECWTPARVRRLRVRPKRQKSFAYLPPSASNLSGALNLAHARHRLDAEEGSAKLLKAIARYHVRRGRTHWEALAA